MVQKPPTIVRAVTIAVLLAATHVALPDRDAHAQSKSAPPQTEASAAGPSSSNATLIEPWLHPPAPTSAESEENPAPDSDVSISTETSQVETGQAETGQAETSQAEAVDRLSGIIWPIPPVQQAEVPIAIPSTPHTPTKPATHSIDGQPLLYLTFDDGPHPVWTKRVLDLLHGYGAHATFFVLGFKAERYPELIVRMAEEGHDVENHTLHHHRLDIADDAEFRHEVLEGDRKIQAALGAASEPPTCLRPPYGLTDERTKGRSEALGKWLVTWDIDPRDWERPGTDRIVKRVLSRVRPGAVVLFHEAGGANQTLAALDQILSHLTAEGYRFARLCADHAAAQPVVSGRSTREQHSPPAQWGEVPNIEGWPSAHETPIHLRASTPSD